MILLFNSSFNYPFDSTGSSGKSGGGTEINWSEMDLSGSRSA